MNEPLNIQLANRERYITRESGSVEGAWLKLPATTEQLNAALVRIGAQGGEHGKDYFINGIETPVAVFDKISLENIQKARIDELNYLAARLETIEPVQIAKLNAAALVMSESDDIHRLIEFTHNTDFFVHNPGVFNHTQLGENCLSDSEMVNMPEAWKGAIDVEKLGQIVAASEKGVFTEHGYICPSGDEWKPVTEIPQEYRIITEAETPDIDYDIAAVNTATVPAQTAAPFVLVADNPRDKLKEITAKLENGINGIFESEQYKTYLQTLSKFHNYSFNNCLLIAMQKPDASHVGGFNFWRDEMKRPVMKGEKGIKIIAPAPFKTKKMIDTVDADGKPVFDNNGQRKKEETEITVPAFTVATVFDVSQTDGESLPQIGVTELTGSVDKYKDFFAALEKTSHVPIGFEEISSGAKGYYHQQEKRIAINEGMSELQNLKTAIHEIAHARLHAIDTDLPLKGQNVPDRRTREVEAESIAYTVCAHYGLDTSDYSFGYVATWSGDKQLDTLKSSLDTIRKEAAAIITEVDKHFAELTQDKEKTAEHQPGFEKWSEPATPDNPGVPSDDINAYLPPQGEQSPAEPKTMTTYYSISEDAARHAKEANSFSDYRKGSATAEYRQSVDEAVNIAEQQKARVDPMYHAKIDRLVDTYAQKLAENMNHRNSIDARVPSIMIAGGSNFPVRQKEKQNAARDTNMREWQDIQGLLEKIQSTGMGGISADDPNAIKKLQSKLDNLEKSQETMKSVNAYYRKNKTLDGCPDLSTDVITKLKASMSRSWRPDPKPFEAYALSNNNAKIHRTKGRIEQLTRYSVAVYVGWQIDGGKVEPNQKDNRLQIIFDGKPDEKIRNELKSNGFRWSPNAGAWQRQLNDNAIYAADRIKCIQPLTGKKPTDLQRAARAEARNNAQQPVEPYAKYTDVWKNYVEITGVEISIQAFYQDVSDGIITNQLLNCPNVISDIPNYEYKEDSPNYQRATDLITEIRNIYHSDILDAPEAPVGTFTIYQLKGGDETRDYRFEPLDRLQAAGHDVDLTRYDLVYSAPISEDTESLGMIYEKFNLDHPEDFTGHSLSVSDIVVMNRDGKETVFYVDSIGFKELPDFLTPREQTAERAAEPQTQGNTLWQNYTALTEQYPDNIIFMKVGDFYEVMGDKANTVANELNIVITGRDVGLAERVPLVGVPAHNFDTVVKALHDNKHNIIIADKDEVIGIAPAPSKPPVDLAAVADYLQKQYNIVHAADLKTEQGQAAFNTVIKRLDSVVERMPDDQKRLTVLFSHAAQSPDLETLKNRMVSVNANFTQHYSTTVQNTVDTSGKAEPKAPAAATVRQSEPAPAPKAPAQGENVAAIEAKVKAGETINLSDLSDAIKKDKQAAQTAPTITKSATRTNTQGKNTAAKPTAPEKPSIRDEIAAGKKQLAAQKSAPAKTQDKNKGLEA